MRRLALALSLPLLLASCGAAPAAAPSPSPASAAPVASPVSTPETPPSVAPTAVPTTTPAPAASATATPARPALAAIPAAKRIGPLAFISQTLNNCGPASIAEVLGYYGVQRTQAQVASVLRPNLPDYGMSLYGVPFYAESVGMSASGGVSGNAQLIKAFVANGLPVIVADQVSRADATRHFRPIDGYDDNGAWFIGSDPYLGPNHQISYADFDDIWRISGGRWVVIYPPAKQELVDAIVARYGDRAGSIRAGLQRAEQRAAQQPRLPWSWLELADVQIDSGDLTDAGPNIQKGTQLGLPFEAHWLQLKLQRAGGVAA